MMDFEKYNAMRGDLEPLVWNQDNLKACEEWKTHVIIPEIIRHEMEVPSSRWLCELMLTKSKYFSVQPVSIVFNCTNIFRAMPKKSNYSSSDSIFLKNVS
jgi:hypothetical protein